MSDPSSEKTHFGFEDVAWEEKEKKVRGVFDSVASRYDIMNDLMSLGVHRLWKYLTLSQARVQEGDTILDCAGGTGDLSIAMSKKVGEQGQVVLADINGQMLGVGRERVEDAGCMNNVRFLQANAESMPVASNQFDVITMAFGLRNVTDKQAALQELQRILKPGGTVYILEFSKPKAWLSPIYDAYSFKLLPKLGKWIADDEDSYRYLAESIRRHPDQVTLKAMLETAGFEDVTYQNMSAGIVALHEGRKY